MESSRREKGGRPIQTVVPAPGALLWLFWGTGKREGSGEGQPSGLCPPSWLPPFLFPHQWDNRKDRHSKLSIKYIS